MLYISNVQLFVALNSISFIQMDVQILKVAFQLKHPAIFGLNSARNVIAPNKIKTIATNEWGGRTKYTKSRPFDNNCANYNNSDTQIDVTTNNATQRKLITKFANTYDGNADSFPWIYLYSMFIDGNPLRNHKCAHFSPIHSTNE